MKSNTIPTKHIKVWRSKSKPYYCVQRPDGFYSLWGIDELHDMEGNIEFNSRFQVIPFKGAHMDSRFPPEDRIYMKF